MSRHNRSCKVCGEDRSEVLETHHRIPRRHGGQDTEENLVTVCANCHRVLESLYDKEFWTRVRERFAAELAGSGDRVYCPACGETFEPGAEHDCSSRGEHLRDASPERSEPEGELSFEAQMEIAQAHRENGRSLRWIAENVDVVEYSSETVRQNTSA